MTIYELLEMYKQAKSIYEMPIQVAYYARVSSEKDAQLHSLDNQIDYYAHLIQNNSNWTYAGGYVDASAIIGLKQNPTKRASL